MLLLRPEGRAMPEPCVADDPPLVLADEPIVSLDTENSERPDFSADAGSSRPETRALFYMMRVVARREAPSCGS